MTGGSSILLFDPQRLVTERHRYGMGVSIICPGHGPPCRLEFYFAEPSDGYRPVSGKKLWGHIDGDLPEISIFPRGHPPEMEELTIYPRGHAVGPPIVVPGHWTGTIISGFVRTSAEPEADPDDVATDPIGVPVIRWIP